MVTQVDGQQWIGLMHIPLNPLYAAPLSTTKRLSGNLFLSLNCETLNSAYGFKSTILHIHKLSFLD